MLRWYHPVSLIVTFFCIGRIPFAPGTFGSLIALPIAYVIQKNAGNIPLFCFAWVLFLLGWLASAYYVHKTGRSDPKEIVIDEVAGQCLLLSVMFPTLVSYVTAFLLFRLFDITKPWPVSWADKRVKGGLGVMLDDIVAAMLPVILTAALALLARYTGFPFSVDNLLQFLIYPNVF